jgi:hypothetical protein
MHAAMVSWGFKRLAADPCVYYRRRKEGILLVAVHVDDFLYASSSAAETTSFKAQPRTLWTISDLGEAVFCVGIAISRDCASRNISISQTALIDRIIATFNQSSAHLVSTPMDDNLKLHCPTSDEPASPAESALPYHSLVGSLMYLAVGTRPDIAYAVSKLTQSLDCFHSSHWTAALRVVRYLLGTRTLSLVLGGDDIALVGFSDYSYADCPDTWRSCMDYCYSVGSAVVTWSSRKQKTVACSTTDAEYIALGETSREAMWLRQSLHELGLLSPSPTLHLCDNDGARVLANDPSHHLSFHP